MMGAILILGMGEELWMRFVPKYLELLGAGVWIVAFYGTLKDFLDAVYQYPGGWLADRLGRRRSLMLFTLLAVLGYVLYLAANNWQMIIAGTVFVMAWSSLTLPATFAVIGDNLASDRRAIGFGMNSILKRIPIVIAPFFGGWLMLRFGLATGFKAGLVITIVLAAFSFLFLRFYREDSRAHVPTHFLEVWHSLSPDLKRLLVADCLARWAEGIPKVFVVLYAMNVLRVNSFEFGWLTSLQQLAAIFIYIPIAKLSDQMNRRPFILLTFSFFALFPLALVKASTMFWIVIAFLISGMREIGEPARKAMIVDLAPEAVRGRTVGVYYFIRGMVVFPASLIGGWLWSIDRTLPFYAAFVVGVIGCLFYGLISRGNSGRRETLHP